MLRSRIEGCGRRPTRRPTVGHPRGVPTTTRPRAPRSLPHLVLRPGTHVLRRSATELQVGLDPRRAVVLPDSPAVRRLLEALSNPAAPLPEGYDAQCIALLADSGLLVDADVLLPQLPPVTGPSTSGPDRADVAALAAVAGDRVVTLVRARQQAQVEVASCGSDQAVAVASRLDELLARARVTTRRLPHGPPPASSARAPAATATATAAGVLVVVGEPPREHLDPWLRAGTPHLLLRLTEGQVVIGPFVLPGHSACLRCVDAHHTDVDPAWPLLVAQYACAVTHDRDDSVPEPVDGSLATLGAAWTVRELVSHAEGRRPATLSTTVRLDPHLTAVETHYWPPHPACGCTWGEPSGLAPRCLPSSATIGA
jgi:bacteriocin biosynthesis cyclodehydratase domain-containing protein